MKRRHFLLLSSLGLPTLVLPSLQGCKKEVGFDPALRQPAMLGLFVDETMVLTIGKKYIGSGNESDQSRLIGLINEAVARSNETTLAGKLSNAIQNDFRDGRMIIIEGWVLSVTEARQCALYSLTHMN